MKVPLLHGLFLVTFAAAEKSKSMKRVHQFGNITPAVGVDILIQYKNIPVIGSSRISRVFFMPLPSKMLFTLVHETTPGLLPAAANPTLMNTTQDNKHNVSNLLKPFEPRTLLTQQSLRQNTLIIDMVAFASRTLDLKKNTIFLTRN